MLSLATGMAAVASAAIALTKIKGLADDFAKYGDNVAKSSVQIGLSVAEFQRLDHALVISGSSMEEQQGAFRRFAKTARDAAAGVKIARDAFDRIGVSVQDSSGEFRGVRELLGEVAEKFRGVTSDVERSALAQDLFGRSGAKMLNFLALGSKGISDLGDEAERLGVVMSEQGTKTAERYTDSMARLEAAALGAKNRIGEWMAESIESGVHLKGAFIILEKFNSLMADTPEPVAETTEEMHALLNVVANLPPQFQGLYEELDAGVAAWEAQQLAIERTRNEMEHTARVMATANLDLFKDMEAAAERAFSAGTKASRRPGKGRRSSRAAKAADPLAGFSEATDKDFQRDIGIRAAQDELAIAKAKNEVDRVALTLQAQMNAIRRDQAGGLDPKIAGLQREIVLQEEANRLAAEAVANEQLLRDARWASADAVVSGVTGLIGAFSQSDKARRVTAGIEGAMQVAYAAAAWATPGMQAQAIGHTAAAAQFFAVAGGAGGGGGSRGGSSGSGSSPASSSAGSSSSAQGGGPSQVVVQINGLVSQQDVAHGVQTAIHAARGTGNVGAGI
jgi:hypothetical protein